MLLLNIQEERIKKGDPNGRLRCIPKIDTYRNYLMTQNGN